MRTGLVMLWMLLCSITPAVAQVSIGIQLPGVSIGINQPVYPSLVAVPGYPVYYAPQGNSNYFFYDGMYWVYQRDNWYASSWYNGPWGLVAPEAVPLFVLRVPVRYYRQPPAYFRGWRSDASPRWGEHWGNAWEQKRRGWDNWNRSSVPRPAPLPVYQRQFSGNRYPQAEQQHVIQGQNYRYQPREAVVQQHYQAQRVQSAPTPTPQARQAPPAPPGQPLQKAGADAQRPATTQAPPPGGANAQQQKPPQQQGAAQKTPPQQQQGAAQKAPPQQQGTAQREQQAPRTQGQDKGAQGKRPAQESKQVQEKAPQGKAPAQGSKQVQEKAPQGKAPTQAPKQVQERAPQGKAPVQAPKQVPEKGREKGEREK